MFDVGQNKRRSKADQQNRQELYFSENSSLSARVVRVHILLTVTCQELLPVTCQDCTPALLLIERGSTGTTSSQCQDPNYNICSTHTFCFVGEIRTFVDSRLAQCPVSQNRMPIIVKHRALKALV